MIRGAWLSDHGAYRYLLVRTWDVTGPLIVWIMLNPSIADADRDDRTMSRVIAHSRRWGYGACAVVNLFAYCATQPDDLLSALDPVGPLNDLAIDLAVKDSDCVVVAWGAYPDRVEQVNARVTAVLARLTAAGRPLHCLGTTQSGQPRHPCRLPGDLDLERWP